VKTLRIRIKDKHAKALDAFAREVNTVWNYVNELSSRAIRERQQFLSALTFKSTPQAQQKKV